MRAKPTLSPILAAFVLACAGLVGCDSAPDTVVGSDVPQIVGLENRHSSGIERAGESLVAGRFVYRGNMRDPVKVADDTIAIYHSYGWTLQSKRVLPTSAELRFAKDDREVLVDLKCSVLNPSMGAGSIDVMRRGATTTQPGAATAAPTPGGAS